MTCLVLAGRGQSILSSALLADATSAKGKKDRRLSEGGIEIMQLETQHCLAIAAAFIAVIAACATLISSANSKAESLSNRIREAAREHRERKDSARCAQLQAQIKLFKARFTRVQDAQRLLFFTIGIFITSLTIFIGIALCLVAGGITNVLVSSIVIGFCVSVGSICMLKAISLQYSEVEASFLTLCIETDDCDGQGGPASLAVVTPQAASAVQGAPEPVLESAMSSLS